MDIKIEKVVKVECHEENIIEKKNPSRHMASSSSSLSRAEQVNLEKKNLYIDFKYLWVSFQIYLNFPMGRSHEENCCCRWILPL